MSIIRLTQTWLVFTHGFSVLNPEAHPVSLKGAPTIEIAREGAILGP